MREVGDCNSLHKWRWRAMSVWVIVFSVALIIAWDANQNRISDIQQSRLYSCKQTYNVLRLGIVTAFNNGKHLSPRGVIVFEKLIKISDPARCESQVKTK